MVTVTTPSGDTPSAGLVSDACDGADPPEVQAAASTSTTAPSTSAGRRREARTAVIVTGTV